MKMGMNGRNWNVAGVTLLGNPTWLVRVICSPDEEMPPWQAYNARIQVFILRIGQDFVTYAGHDVITGCRLFMQCLEDLLNPQLTFEFANGPGAFSKDANPSAPSSPQGLGILHERK